jgi:hypothetical protein
VISINELKMLRNKAFSDHPWMVANVSRAVAHIRRELGTETWELVTSTLEQARATKDVALWQSLIDSLIITVNQPRSQAVTVIKDGVVCWKCGDLFSISSLRVGTLILYCDKCSK